PRSFRAPKQHCHVVSARAVEEIDCANFPKPPREPLKFRACLFDIHFLLARDETLKRFSSLAVVFCTRVVGDRDDCLFGPTLGFVSSALAADLDTARIDQISGLKGKFNEKEGVYKVTFPRNDVKVFVDGWIMPPFMGLGTWAAFTPTQNGAMVMGDTVLFEDEVNAAMSAALDNGLNVTALHNHFFFDHPKVYFMHIEGEGPADKLAAAVRKVYDAAKQIRAASPNPKDSFGAAQLPEESSITDAPLNE